MMMTETQKQVAFGELRDLVNEAQDWVEEGGAVPTKVWVEINRKVRKLRRGCCEGGRR